MKTKNVRFAILMALPVLFYSCQKENSAEVQKAASLKAASLNGAQEALAASETTPLSVITIAGKNPTTNFDPQLVDGVGSAARFTFPYGIDLADDGTLYVADLGNSAIRKISPPNIVTTIPIPNRADGEKLFNPQNVRLTVDGSLNITVGNDGHQAYNKHPIWILKNDGTISTPIPNPNSGLLICLERDPSGNLFFSQDLSLKKFALDANGRMGTNKFTPNTDSLAAGEGTNAFRFMALRCANNGIKYMFSGHHMYKLTPSGLFTMIYRDLSFFAVSSIVSTKDTRTLYIADNGAIKSIFNGKMQYLVGPNPRFPGERDGVGSNASVYAKRLALSKDERTLYFSDNYTIRKLILK